MNDRRINRICILTFVMFIHFMHSIFFYLTPSINVTRVMVLDCFRLTHLMHTCQGNNAFIECFPLSLTMENQLQ